MEKLSLLTADLLDILFEYRNKMYGAYELRRTYPRRMAYAVCGTVFICLLFVGGTLLANAEKASQFAEIKDIQLSKIVVPEEPPVQPPPPLPKQEIPKVEMTTFTPPKIVADELVQPEEEVKDIEKLDETRLGPINQEGVKDDGTITPPVETSKLTTKDPQADLDVDRIYTTVQIPASFPGGAGAWNKYLQSHLNSDVPIQNGAPVAKYTVIVSFVVARDGSISDVVAENDPGYGTTAEALRVIRKGPNWVAAVQNGRNVIYRHKQTITFQVNEE